jgi:hypothetical protein
MSTRVPLDTPVSPAPGHRWRNWTLLCSVLVLGLAGVYSYLAYLSDQRLQEALAEAERLDSDWRLEDMEAKRPVVPDDENATLAIAAAKKLAPGAWVNTIYEALEPRPDTPQQLNTEQTKALREELQKLQPALVEARRLAQLPRARYDFSWKGDWIGKVVSVVQPVRTVTNLLQYDAMLRCQDGDLDGALVSCRAILNASRSLRDQPLLISLLVRLACHQVALATLNRILAQGQPSEEALSQLQRMLEEEEAEPLLLTAFRGERANADALLEAVIRGDVAAAQVYSPGYIPGSPAADRLLSTVLGGSVRGNRGALLKYMNRVVEIAKLPEQEQYRELDQLLANLPRQTMFVRQMASSMTKVGEATRRGQALLRSALVLVAAERYRLKHGRWPEALTDLVPDYLRFVPADPYDGAPLRYRRLADGVVSYSVGLDGQDNGGTLDPSRPLSPGTDVGYRLWDIDRRRQPAPADTAGTPP